MPAAQRHQKNMKMLSCKDLDSDIECDFTAEDETDDGVIRKMVEHAKREHPEKIQEMMENMSAEEIEDRFRMEIKEAW
jgi:predicted small metal-binding protein